MSENTSKHMTILFADVAGSVELYTELGDVQAHQRIILFQKSMTTLIERTRGWVVETIGDEIMCAFNDTDDAVTAACGIQESVKNERGWNLEVRVGIHAGSTGMENGRLFGDTVNVAARAVALAKAGQIMLTDYACQRLSEEGKSRTRYFSEVHIKGKREPYIIHQVQWDQDDGTILVQRSENKPVERRRRVNRFFLRYQDTEVTLEEGSELLLGRGDQCSLRVQSESASRIHAAIKCHKGRLILADRSTNGTFIRTQEGNRFTDNSDLFFHHDEWATTCEGIISLGQPIGSQTDTNLIHFGHY